MSSKTGGKKAIACAMCKFHGKGLNDIMTHRRTTHTVGAKCTFTMCGFAGKGMDELRNCMDIFAVCVAYICDECDFNSRSNVVLRHHVTTHGLNIAYQCTLCYF